MMRDPLFDINTRMKLPDRPPQGCDRLSKKKRSGYVMDGLPPGPQSGDTVGTSVSGKKRLVVGNMHRNTQRHRKESIELQPSALECVPLGSTSRSTQTGTPTLQGVALGAELGAHSVTECAHMGGGAWRGWAGPTRVRSALPTQTMTSQRKQLADGA